MAFGSMVRHAFVASGATVTGNISIAGIDTLGVFCHFVTVSCQAFMQVSPLASPTSASYMRLSQVVPGSSAAVWDLGPGSRAAVFNGMSPFPSARIEFGVAQTNAGTLTCIGKRTGYYG